MADLKTFIGISDTNIKSVSGLSADYTKTILGTLLKQIPQPSEALFWLDGVIVEDGGSKYFRDRTSNDRKFLITDYDFDSTWVAGFPYKSAATISAPAADAALIAADINNYLYAADGTPNQIPIVSLFQDIDYEHKLFCRHFEQVVDANGVETNEPRVLDITMYNSVREGTPLTLCQSYFSVPTEDLTAKWVSKTGNDSTGNGTKANPYLTINKASEVTIANGTIYVKTGIYAEDKFGGGLRIDVACETYGLGLCTVVPDGSTGRVVALRNDNVQLFQGFIVDSGLALCLYATAGSKTINRCKFINATDYSINGTGSTTVVKNSILLGVGVSGYATTIDVDTCLIKTSGNKYSYFSDASSSLSTLNINRNKIIPGTGTIQSLVYVLVNATINAIGNSFDISSISARCLYASGSLTNILNIEHNTFISSSTIALPIIQGINTNTATFVIKNNTFNLTSEGTSTASAIIRLDNQVDPVIENNIFTKNTTASLSCVAITSGGKTTAPQISNNRITSLSLTGYEIMIGTESSTANDNKITPSILNNYISGPRDNGITDVGSCHTVYVGYNINPEIKYNYIKGGVLGLIFKHEGGVYATDNVSYNLLENCNFGVLAKGVDGLKLYNNTIVSEIANSYGIATETHTTETSNLIIKNNIIKTVAQCILVTDGAEIGLISDYNSIISESDNVANYVDTVYSFAAWNGLGFDLNSINTDPQLTNLIPASLIEGVDLGETYNDGLDVATTWGSLTSIPVITTKQQAATWQMGAYVQD